MEKKVINDKNNLESNYNTEPLNISPINDKLNNIIIILINYEKIKQKMKRNLELKNNFYTTFYLINYDWFNKYLELNNLNEIYDYILNNKIIENIMNNYNNNNQIIENDKIIKQVLSKLSTNMINKIKRDNNNYDNLKNINIFQLKLTNKFYSNFLIIKEKSVQFFNKQFCFCEKNKFNCILGDNKIFIKIDENGQNNLEIGYINEKNIFIPEILFNYIDKTNLDNNIFSLIKHRYNSYCENFLKNENDSISIINKSNNIIGHAYKYAKPNKLKTQNKEKKIDKKNLINKNLNILIQYYFLNSNFDYDSNKIIGNKFYLINASFMRSYKSLWNYNHLETELNKNNMVKKIKDKINCDDNGSVSEEKIIELSNSLPSEINNIFNKKESFLDNFFSEPNIAIFTLNSINYFYYNDLILLNESIYNSIIKQSSSEKQNYVKCYFINKYILFKVPNNINKSKKIIIELGNFNKEKVLNIKYLLIFDNIKDFESYLQFIIRVFGFDNFIKGLNFTSNNIKLFDSNNKEVGIIFNLEMKETNSIENNNNIINKNIKASYNIQNSINETGITSIKENFQSPPLIGLKNIDESMNFINVVLQCFCHIEKFVNYFKYRPRINEIINLYQNQKKEISLTNLFKIIIENLWPSNNEYIDKNNNDQNNNNKYYSPNNFKENITKLYPGIKDPLNKEPKNYNKTLSRNKIFIK